MPVITASRRPRQEEPMFEESEVHRELQASLVYRVRPLSKMPKGAVEETKRTKYINSLATN